MSIAEEIEKLQALHAQGALTDDEFSQAKATLLARLSDEQPASDTDALNEEVEYLREQSDELSEEVEYLRVQKELSRLDRDWERERESHMICGRYGARYLPSAGRSVIGMISVIGVGIYMIFSWASVDSGLFLPLALVFIIVGVIVSVYQFDKAGVYRKAERRYQERRSDLISRRSSRSREL